MTASRGCMLQLGEGIHRKVLCGVPIGKKLFFGTAWTLHGDVQALASIVFLRLHPKPLRHTPSYEFTTSFGGVCWGIVVGMSRQQLMYKQNIPGRFVQIIQSRLGVMALIQRVAVGKHVECLTCLATV